MAKTINDINYHKNGKKVGKVSMKAFADGGKQAESIDEFVGLLGSFLKANQAEFAIYISKLGVLPKSKQQGFALFSENKTLDEEDAFHTHLSRIAVMFHELCVNKHRDVLEELVKFTGAVALAADKSGSGEWDEKDLDALAED